MCSEVIANHGRAHIHMTLLSIRIMLYSTGPCLMVIETVPLTVPLARSGNPQDVFLVV
jgi:hypothetical protein